MTSGKSRILAVLAIMVSSLMIIGGRCGDDDGDCIGIVCDDDKALVE